VPPQPHVAVVAIDASPHSAHALNWAASHLRLGPRDELHVVSVAAAAPRPTLEEEAAAMAVMEAAEFQRACEHNLSAARAIAELAADRVRDSLGSGAAGGGRPGGEPGAGQPRVLSEGLLPEGGASDAGAAVAKYAAAQGADLVVVGSRGMGAFKRITMGLLGLGSGGWRRVGEPAGHGARRLLGAGPLAQRPVGLWPSAPDL
jgi:nucleotide-binding universal stress UspA family protein